MAGYFLSVIVCCQFIGCTKSDFPSRCRVEGHVAVDGVPMEKGLITFIPISPTKGPKASGIIEQGEYVIEEDIGPCSGRFLVKITTVSRAVEAIATKRLSAREKCPLDDSRPVVAPAYDQESQLRAIVSKEGENRFDFEVKSVQEEEPEGDAF